MTFKNPIRRRWTMAVLYPAALCAGAADTSPLATVVTIQGSAAAYNARRDDTAARIVVGRDELTRFGDASAADVLKRQGGVTVDANGAIALRGLGKGYTQILLDGDKAPAGFDIGSLSPELIERIEISRTPTADVRAEAIAGTINIVLRKAGRRSARSAKLQASRTRAAPGTLVSLELAEPATPGAPLSWQLAGSGSESRVPITWRNRSTGTDAAGQPDLRRHGGLDMLYRARIVSLNPTASYKLANGDTLSLQAQLTRGIVDKDARGFSDTLLGQAEDVVADTQVTAERNTLARASLEWTHRFDGAANLNLKLDASQFQRAADFGQQGRSALGLVNLRDRTTSAIVERTAKHSGKYASRLDERHALVLGWDIERTRRHETRHQDLRRNGATQLVDFGFDATVDRLAFYVQDEWSASERLALYLGLRAERIALLTSGSGFAATRRSDNVFSPVVQALWKLPGAPGRQVRAGLGRTYKAPAAMSLVPRPYTSTNNDALTPDERGNPRLEPELALGLDGAFEHHWTDGAMFSVGGYVRRVDGVTLQSVVREDGRWVGFPVNGGRALLRGLEFDTRFKLADLAPAAPKVDLRFNVTRNWSQVEDVPGPDNRVGDQPRLSATVGANFQAGARWSLGASYSYKQGGWARTALDRYSMLGSRGELDAYALLSIQPRLKLRAALSNALGQDSSNGSRHVDSRGERQIAETRRMPVVLRVALEWSK